MKRMLEDWGIAVLVAALAFFVVGLFRGGPETGGTAPAIDLVDLDGRPASLEALAGQTVVVNFWASWCGPCRQEVPEFARFHEDHPEVAMVGIAVDSGDAPDVRRAARSFGITWPVAVGDRATVQAYGVDTLPTTVVISGDGEVVASRVGTMDYEDLVRATR